MICLDKRDASVLFHFTCEGYFSSFVFIKRQIATLSAFIFIVFLFQFCSLLFYYFFFALTLFSNTFDSVQLCIFSEDDVFLWFAVAVPSKIRSNKNLANDTKRESNIKKLHHLWIVLFVFYGGYLIKSNNKFKGNNSHNSTLLIQKSPCAVCHTMNTKSIIHTSLALFSLWVHVLIWSNIYIFFPIKNSGVWKYIFHFTDVDISASHVTSKSILYSVEVSTSSCWIFNQDFVMSRLTLEGLPPKIPFSARTEHLYF